MKNIIIPLGVHSNNNDIELKYCLRSLPEHDNVYVIGRNPNLPNIIHIPFIDKPGIHHTSENIYRKIMHAFTFLDEFYCISDDYFVLPGFDYNAYYFDGLLENKLVPTTSEDYKLTVRNTIKYLRERNLPTKFFNVHAPIYYRKELFPVIDTFPSHGFALQSLYCNINGIKGTYHSDLKIKQKLPKNRIEEIIKERLFFSTNDYSINRNLIEVLQELYPVASKYELMSTVA